MGPFAPFFDSTFRNRVSRYATEIARSGSIFCFCASVYTFLHTCNFGYRFRVILRWYPEESESGLLPKRLKSTIQHASNLDIIYFLDVIKERVNLFF